MKVDVYCDGDPWNPRTWSRTPLELVTTLKNKQFIGNTYNINPERDDYKFKRLIKNIRFLTYRNKGIRVKSHHPAFLKKRIIRLQNEAVKTFKLNPKPNAILTVAVDVSFDNIPFFPLHDLDIATIIKWRNSGEEMFMFEHLPFNLLNTMKENQIKVFNKAYGIFVASKWIADGIKSYINTPQKVYPVGIGHRYNPINLTEEILEKRFEEPTLLFIGRQFVRKGMTLMIDAFNSLREEIPGIKFNILTNENEIPKNYLKIIKQDPTLNLKLSVPTEQLRENYLNSSIFTMPSFFEPWGKVFFEAMAFGLPILGANKCAMPEFIINGHNGFVVDPFPQEVVKRICDLLNSYENYKKFSQNSLKLGEKFKLENVVETMISHVKISLS